MNLIILLPLVIAVMIALTACTPAKGCIVILENPKGKGFSMEFKEFSARNKCELALNKDDVIQIEMARESGEIALTVSGKNGSEPYTGNHFESGIFTVGVSETDVYMIRIIGKNATGKITVKNLGNGVD